MVQATGPEPVMRSPNCDDVSRPPRTSLILAMTLAAYEDATSREDWRRPNPRTARYLTHLATLGYTLSEVEQRACTVAADRSGGTH